MIHNFDVGQYHCKLHIVDGVYHDRPLIVELAFQDHSDEVIQCCAGLGTRDFNYLSITGLSWDDDLSPWQAKGLLSKDDSFGGNGDVFLAELVNRIIPHANNLVQLNPSEIFLVGYSLAGLCALYGAYTCDAFSGVASISGALWYPQFSDFVKVHSVRDQIQRIYLSLGDKEYKTRNPHMSTVQDRTEEIHAHLVSSSIDTIFELNPGNHFKDEVLRISKGIRWLMAE